MLDADSTQSQRTLKWTVFLGFTAFVIYACLLVLTPCLNVIAWSCVLAIAFYPVHERLVQKTGRVALSALLCSLLVVFVILIPLMFITGLAINQLLGLKDYLQATFAGGFSLSAIEPLRRGLEWLSGRLGFETAEIGNWVAQHANELGRVIAEHSLAIAASVTSLVVSFIFTIFAMFLLFRDGPRLLAAIPDLLPFERTRSEAMLLHVRDVIYGSVYGVVVVALIQGLLCGAMFWILGIPSAALWGMTTVLTSVLPVVGAAGVWVPGALYLFAVGHWVQAIILAAWGTFVISGVDNFLRPKLIGDRIGLSELIMFFAILGGLQVFGLLGIVLGPVLFAVAVSILELLNENEKKTVEHADS